ncbi:MAG: cell division protein FtsH [Planctomycetota bacterium]
MDEEDTVSAYHEAGHAVVGYALGAKIDAVQLGGEADDFLPERFGECRVNWGRVDPNQDSQRQRELMTILAGPVAEMIYTGEKWHPAFFGPWQSDWCQATTIATGLVADPARRVRLLETMAARLHQVMSADGCWAAIAAVADELETHEFVESDTIEEVVGFWLRHSG